MRSQSTVRPKWKRRGLGMARNESVLGVYTSRSAVELGITYLREARFASTGMSILLPGNLGPKELTTRNVTKAPEGTTGWSGFRCAHRWGYSDGWWASALWRSPVSVRSLQPRRLYRRTGVAIKSGKFENHCDSNWRKNWTRRATRPSPLASFLKRSRSPPRLRRTS